MLRTALRPVSVPIAACILAGGISLGCGARETPAKRGAGCPEPSASAPTADRDPSRDSTRIVLDLIDTTRSTPAIPSRAALPCRILPTEIRFPTRAIGQLPLIVVAHGLDGDPSSLALLLDTWSRAGYVVAAPRFPTTKKDPSGSSLPSESVEQARDMSFVIDQMLALGADTTTGPLRGRVDGHHIGAAGMSLGGLTVYGLISNTCCRDRRVGAAVLLAAVRRQFIDDHYEDNRAPVLLIQGDADPGYHNSATAYPELVAPKWFITLRGANHSPPFEVPPGLHAPVAYATTTAFWDRYLKLDDAAAHRIVALVAASSGQACVRYEVAPSHASEK